jgi:hypothetical protein
MVKFSKMNKIILAKKLLELLYYINKIAIKNKCLLTN